MNDSINNQPIVFILGLSGVGKSELGTYLEEDLDFLHIEQDSTDGDGIDIWGLRKEWDYYLSNKNAFGLAKSIRNKAVQKSKKGTVLTFSSMVTPSNKDIESAQKAGIVIVLLDGSDDDCLSSYLKRERETGRNYDKNRWLMYNASSSAKFRSNYNELLRVKSFDNHVHQTRQYLVEEVLNIINKQAFDT